MTNLTLGVDAGNDNGKVAGPYGVDTFKTAICDWFPRNVSESWGEDDMEFEINGRKGLAGSVALVEDQFGGGAMYGESKVHEDTKIRVLLALHRYIEKYAPDTTHVSLVTGQPIKTHTPEEKAALADMLRGTHEYTVNGIERKLTIVDVGVAPEGSAAFWSNPQDTLCRIIDVGSGTVNCATIKAKRNVNVESRTFNFGMETVDGASLDAVALAITRNITKLKWRKDDPIYVCGGAANEILPHLASHLTNVKALIPQLQLAEGYAESHEPIYANAIGFYEIARLAFG
ncbi:actin-like protein [Sporosarcina phage Lietuvens]|nr:actin-like protein [Sporosarcina phage Lietuvens]